MAHADIPTNLPAQPPSREVLDNASTLALLPGTIEASTDDLFVLDTHGHINIYNRRFLNQTHSFVRPRRSNCSEPQVILTGIRPQVAQPHMGPGVDLGGIVTRGTLQSGIAYALERATSDTRSTP